MRQAHPPVGSHVNRAKFLFSLVKDVSYTSKIQLALLGLWLLLCHPVNAGSWQTGQALGGFNNVNVYTPTSYSPIGPNGSRSLLVILHGCTQAISAYNTANLEVAAEQYGMVIAVPDAQHKEGFSCWAYWSNSNSGSPARNKLDYENLIQLAEEMTQDSARVIDRNQVYIAGLSSGAAFANTTACLAPDIFAGMGISAGPSIGTTSSGALGSCESANVASRCLNYAGSFASFFATQIASMAQADDDSTVSTCYNTQNANGMADVYGVSQLSGTTPIGSGGNTATETQWQDGRVAMLWFHGGVGHAWSGGSGASGSYVSGNSINYAAYLGEFFTNNNRRVNRNTPPAIDNLSVTVTGAQLQINAVITDAETAVASATAVISDALTSSGVGNVNLLGSNNQFTGMSANLADGLYTLAVTAVDDEGGQSEASIATARIGPEPPAQAPQLSNLEINTNGQCATVNGAVVDANLNLEQVIATFATGDFTAVITGNQFSAEACGLPGGANSVTITAIDTTNLSTNAILSFTIDAGQIATLDEHISAGRLDYTNYANCYLEYGASAFRLDELVTNNSDSICRWQDDDASCRGPEVQCSSANAPGDDGDNGGDDGGDDTGTTCEEYSDVNYNHKAFYGRAYSTGSFFSPDYYAVGSDQPMPGSTYGVNTLHSLDGGAEWLLGGCP